MISLKAVQTCFITTKHDFFHSTKNHHHSRLLLCKSKDSDTNTPSSPPPPPSSGGDARKQDLLARIAMLQAQKVRLTDYLDERSAYLTQFAEEANVEFDQVGENALKELEEASARIMGNIESQMQAFEESAESSKLALIGLVSISIVEPLISSSFDWRKGVVLGVILVGLLTQLTFYMGIEEPRSNHVRLPCTWSSVVIRCMRPEFHLGINFMSTISQHRLLTPLMHQTQGSSKSKMDRMTSSTIFNIGIAALEAANAKLP